MFTFVQELLLFFKNETFYYKRTIYHENDNYLKTYEFANLFVLKLIQKVFIRIRIHNVTLEYEYPYYIGIVKKSV